PEGPQVAPVPHEILGVAEQGAEPDAAPLAAQELALLEVLSEARRVAERDRGAHRLAAERVDKTVDDPEAGGIAADQVVQRGPFVDAAGDVAVELREAPAPGSPEGVVA